MTSVQIFVQYFYFLSETDFKNINIFNMPLHKLRVTCCLTPWSYVFWPYVIGWIASPNAECAHDHVVIKHKKEEREEIHWLNSSRLKSSRWRRESNFCVELQGSVNRLSVRILRMGIIHHRRIVCVRQLQLNTQ